MPNQDEEERQESISYANQENIGTRTTPPPPPENPVANKTLSDYDDDGKAEQAAKTKAANAEKTYPNLYKNILFGAKGLDFLQEICREAESKTGVDCAPLTVVPNSPEADSKNLKATYTSENSAIHFSTGSLNGSDAEIAELFRHELQHYIQQHQKQVDTNVGADFMVAQNPALEKSAEKAEKGDFTKGAQGTHSVANQTVEQHKPKKPFDLNAPDAKFLTKSLYVYGTDAIVVDSTTNEAWYLENADTRPHSLQHFEEDRAAWTPFSAEDYKVCKMTSPANLSATATPPETDTSTQKSEYWTKELIAPFAKVLAPEQMAELQSLLDAIHPNKQNQDATLTASSNQMLALPLFPLVVPALVELGEFIVLGYLTYTTVTTVQAVTLPYIEDLLSRYFSGTMLPTVEVEAEKIKTAPAPTGTGWLPDAIWISKPKGKSKPKQDEPNPKKDPEQPFDGGLLPLAGLVAAANAWNKNRKKQETPTADLTFDEEHELEELTERANTEELSPREKSRQAFLELKKQQPEADTPEKIQALIKKIEENPHLSQKEKDELLKALNKRLDKLKKSKKGNTDAPETDKIGANAVKMSEEEIGEFFGDPNWHSKKYKRNFLKKFTKELKGDTNADFYVDENTKQILLLSNANKHWVLTDKFFK